MYFPPPPNCCHACFFHLFKLQVPGTEASSRASVGLCCWQNKAGANYGGNEIAGAWRQWSAQFTSGYMSAFTKHDCHAYPDSLEVLSGKQEA